MDSTLLKKPNWLKVKIPSGKKYVDIKARVKALNLATVCQEARCPNMAECWGGGTATIMLMGDVCTRGCRFCSVKTGNPRGVLDELEPLKVAQTLAHLDLDYVVLTSVDRDDLPDQGSNHFAAAIRKIKQHNPNMKVEVLTPDFSGRKEFIETVVRSKPDVFAHNVETVQSLQKKVRDPRANYQQSLGVLKLAKELDPVIYTKTSLMLGLGETDEEIRTCLDDLRAIDCDVVTFGQYLQPTSLKLKVKAYVTPEKFKTWQTEAEAMGFLYVASGPLVRSSYRAGEFFMKGLLDAKKKY